ncbi:hypothetical protein [Agrococcus sp. Marseille-Q4369]|uniref:hypothetical protein n=1 Tax=Agrococcus sp. Marseille-Q4369 TaxID=2810513 RepID=UPI001B8D71DF|nr:hypothetical protein [Agrococcus sp. Marseille-Q4369]QUW18821.1 hypothetical protein JSQ78_00055 [Agrococcus sp. Marseille-Q4369]
MLRLDPHLAVFRSAPDRVTVGAQQPVAELPTDDATLRGLALLMRGVVRRELEHVLGDEPAAALLEALEPALEPLPPAVPTRVRGRIPFALELHRALDRAGHRAGDPAGDDALVLPVAPWRLPYRERDRLVASGAAHLPVVVGDAWVQIGPFVPAGGGCAECAIDDEALLPAHLAPVPSVIAAAQTVVTVLGALRRIGQDELPEGWGARVRQRDGGVSAIRRARRACRHRAPRGIATAA